MGRQARKRLLETESQEDRALVTQVLELTQLTSLREQGFSTLSGGEKQRVLMARRWPADPDSDPGRAHQPPGYQISASAHGAAAPERAHRSGGHPRPESGRRLLPPAVRPEKRGNRGGRNSPGAAHPRFSPEVYEVEAEVLTGRDGALRVFFCSQGEGSVRKRPGHAQKFGMTVGILDGLPPNLWYTGPGNNWGSHPSPGQERSWNRDGRETRPADRQLRHRRRGGPAGGDRRVEEALRRRVPELPFARGGGAYTSPTIRRILAQRGTAVPSLEEALEEQLSAGAERLYLLPTHLLPGYEYDAIAATVESFRPRFRDLRLAPPLMGGHGHGPGPGRGAHGALEKAPGADGGAGGPRHRPSGESGLPRPPGGPQPGGPGGISWWAPWRAGPDWRSCCRCWSARGRSG